MDYDVLTEKHPEYLKWQCRWADFKLLYKGGDEFLWAAGQDSLSTRSPSTAQTAVASATSSVPGSFTKKPRRFLWQLEGEPNAGYFARLERCFYVGYVGPIIDYYVQWLFSQKPNIQFTKADSADSIDAPDWWRDFEKDCTGAGVAFNDFLRDRFRDEQICRRAGWLIGSPVDTQDMSQAEAEEADVDGVVLTEFDACEILDWQKDSAGKLEWVVLCKEELRRSFPDKRLRVETLRYIDRNVYASWEAIDGKTQGTKTLQFLGSSNHNLGRVPFVMPEIPEGLWIMNKLASAQVDLFNQSQILARGELLSCFLQPAITSNDDTAQSRIFGEGDLLRLKGGNTQSGEQAETFALIGGDPAPLEFVAKRIGEKIQEIYRTVYAMSLAVDGQNASAVARSGLSKQEERRASEIILAGLGGFVREAYTQTLDIVAQIMEDDVTGVVDGYDNFQVSSLEEEVQIAVLASSMNFKSTIAKEKIETKLIHRILDHVDEGTLTEIDKQTRDGYEQEEEAKMAPQIDPNTGLPLAPVINDAPAKQANAAAKIPTAAPPTVPVVAVKK